MTIDYKQNLFLLMGSLFHESRQYLDEVFKQFDLSRPEWLILALLRLHREGISQSFAKSYVGIETSYFTKILNRLEEREFIIREIDTIDRRNRIIKINSKSSKKLKKIFEILHDFTESLQSDLNKGQTKDLYLFLEIICKKMRIIKTNN